VNGEAHIGRLRCSRSLSVLGCFRINVAYGQDWLLLLMPAAARHGGDVRLCSACAAEEQLPQHHVQAICLGMYPVSYNDLTELARLCLRQANTARTPAVANELRRMAEEYQARAAALMGGQLPDIGERALLFGVQN
jgi:hypothetical protein